METIKRLSIFNERTKYKFHTEISDVVNNITKENGLTLVNKSSGYSLQKKEGSMVRQLIDYMTDDVNVLRADDAVSDITQKEALKNAPKKDSTYFKIPKVLTR